MSLLSRRLAVLSVILVAVLAPGAGALAQSYPSRPITLIVPFAPGGASDVTARILAEQMSATLGQQVVIENRSGGGGSIGAGYVAKAAPDGYTIAFGSLETHVTGIISKPDYDLEKGFESIALVVSVPQLMVAKKNLPANSLGELVTWMKANPGKITLGGPGTGTVAHLTGELFENLTKQKMTFVPYRGSAPALTDVIGGQLDLLIVPAAVALPHIRSGQIKALATLSPVRSAAMPDIPTAEQSGLSGLHSSGWYGFWAPKGTPKEITAKLSAAAVRTLADPATQKRFTDMGLDVAPRAQQTPEGLAAFQKAEIDKWWPIIKAAGLATPPNRPAAQQVAAAPPAAVVPPPPVAAPIVPAPSIVAQPPAANAASKPDFGRRVALVIGNSAYQSEALLPNPQRDATTVADTLRRLGFQSVALEVDVGREKLVNALRDFSKLADTADWAVVYFAGHGMEVGGANYLLPVDAKIDSDRDVAFAGIPLDQVLNATERAGKLRLVILDACRSNPYANRMKRTMASATRSVSRGLSRVEPDAGTLVVYAAKDGETALDGVGGTNSPFTTALVKNMLTPNVEVRRLFDFVRDDVIDLTKKQQTPYTYGSISGRQDFYFLR